jgi:hypothetical protein
VSALQHEQFQSEHARRVRAKEIKRLERLKRSRSFSWRRSQ